MTQKVKDKTASTHPIQIAFMGRTLAQTQRFLFQYCKDNQNSFCFTQGHCVKFEDGTLIIPISPTMVRSHLLAGLRFDKLILADYYTSSYEVEIFAQRYMRDSCVPKEFQVQYYDPFEEE